MTNKTKQKSNKNNIINNFVLVVVFTSLLDKYPQNRETHTLLKYIIISFWVKYCGFELD